MSLSRPVTFPFLKLPWLSIKCVLHHMDEFVVIYFATISNRSRRIVKNSNYPLKEIDVHLNGPKRICMGIRKSWYFIHDDYADYGDFLVLQKGSVPLRTFISVDSGRDFLLKTYTVGDELDALKNGINFMVDVFGCSVGKVFLDGKTISKPLELGITSVRELYISGEKRNWREIHETPINITDLKNLLETIQVIDKYIFIVPISTDFHCDSQIFKSRKLSFCRQNSADWVTLEVLCQLNVPRLDFFHHQFSANDIVSYITHWFNSDNRKLEYFFALYNRPVSQRAFKIDHLNPMPFCEKRRSRCPLKGIERWEATDMSSGMDILRPDGLLATFYVNPMFVFFYIWHKRFPDDVQHN